ncbi:hypothetical protein EDF62_1838 [Leucobacter luti]|uniref:LPXTG-motif cell wall-anchored protein n=1 Tax=Leucobacter luti TaxID=340320 RepID=A0A4R6RZI5_9MICO|nr:hypothetical protein [Leucobacter luti]TDP92619.1 hypothetical protein EDF62_1838 [Leucobacter luti]
MYQLPPLGFGAIGGAALAATGGTATWLTIGITLTMMCLVVGGLLLLREARSRRFFAQPTVSPLVRGDGSGFLS